MIIALKNLGVKKDWEKTHIDGAFSLIEKQNGATYNLLKGVTVSREYDKLVLTKNTAKAPTPRPIRIGEFEFAGKTYKIEKIEGETPDLKSGLFADFDKIPKTAVIRKREDGDVFVKFGGGKKSLGDYFTDKKIAKRVRDEIPLIANGNDILAIFGVAVSDKIKVDGATRNIIRIR